MNLLNYTIDLWTLWHAIGFGAVAAALIATGMPAGRAVVWTIAVGLAWEVVEANAVEPWLGFREPFWNRYLTDPLADALGAAAGAAVGCRARARTQDPRP
jgi:hypothetical protein